MRAGVGARGRARANAAADRERLPARSERSFDGRRIVFAYARDQRSDSDYHLWEINADGSGLRQLTTSPPFAGPEPPLRGPGWHDVEPCYLPGGGIVFTSTRYVRFVDCVDVEPVTTLFTMDADGRRLAASRPITSTIGTLRCSTTAVDLYPLGIHRSQPDVAAQAFCEKPRRLGHGGLLRQQFVVAGVDAPRPRGPRLQPGDLHARRASLGHRSDGRDRTLGPIAGHGKGEGVVALFPPRKIEPIYRDDPAPRPATRYTEPYPLSDEWFIVSGQPEGAKRFGLYLADFRGNRLLLYEDEKLDCLSAMPLAARPCPPVIRAANRLSAATTPRS